MSVELKVPAVGESITEVFVGEWYKSEGDSVGRDENLVELESEKATFDAPAPAAGVLSKILKQTGESAQVGEVIAYIDETAEPTEAREAKTERPQPQKRAADKEAKPEAAPSRRAPEPAEDETRVMPAARRVLAEHGLRPEDVKATGPGGRLLKEDVLRHVERREEPAARAQAERPQLKEAVGDGAREQQVVPMSPIRRRIAQRLVEAQQTAALLTTFNEIDMSAVIELRNQFKDAFQKKYDIKLGFMSFFVKAVVDALKQTPQVNAEIRDDSIVFHNYYDIGIAIGGGKGLVVPVLRNAERLSFAEIELAISDFGQRARNNKLMPDELRGGTFTISNGGIYGSLLSTPIVNPPQSGVLGMHAIQDRPVAVAGQVAIRPMMYIALSYDHRIVDGREAVTFLKRIKDVLETPARMLLEV
jgi:2-oxoglutarate dehydrogenase E2 component (dihydrolipoamide succinyltransferase)